MESTPPCALPGVLSTTPSQETLGFSVWSPDSAILNQAMEEVVDRKEEGERTKWTAGAGEAKPWRDDQQVTKSDFLSLLGGCKSHCGLKG